MILLLFYNLKSQRSTLRGLSPARLLIRATQGRDAAVAKLGVVGKFRVCRRVIVVSIVSIVINMTTAMRHGSSTHTVLDDCSKKSPARAAA